MVDSLIGSKGDGRSSSYRDGSGRASRSTVHIAAKVGIGKNGHWAIVWYRSNVLIERPLGAVGGQVLEHVWKIKYLKNRKRNLDIQ